MRKILLLTIGIFSVLLGIVGILLPVIPGTPFLLAGLVFLVKGSSRMNLWIHQHWYFGPRIIAYRQNPGITFNEKILMIGLMWVSVTVSYIMTGVTTISIVVSLVGALGTLVVGFVFPTSK